MTQYLFNVRELLHHISLNALSVVEELTLKVKLKFNNKTKDPFQILIILSSIFN